MSSFEKKVEEFAQKVIEQHGFYNDNLSCLVPDKDFKEGLFLWVFSPKRMRFETKIEKFHAPARFKKMEEMLNVSEKEYKKLFSAVEDYLKSLNDIGFENIGKGVILFDEAKLYNVQASADFFEKNLGALKKFEQLTLNNPIIKFVEKHGYFKTKEPDKLVWEKFFGRVSSTNGAARTAKARAAAKAAAKARAATKAAKTNSVSGTKATTAKKASNAKANIAKAATAKATAAKKAATSAKPAAATKKPDAATKKPDAATKKPAAAKTNTKANSIKARASSSKATLSSTRTMPFADKLKKLATSQPESSLDGEKKRKAWTQQVDGLYKKVQTWFSNHHENGYVTFNVHKTKLTEENLGVYDINSLELDLVGGHQVIFQPIEMNILGSVGRIDVFHRGYNPHKVMLLLHDDGKEKPSWELWKGFRKEEQLPFNKGSLEMLLNQWIDS